MKYLLTILLCFSFNVSAQTLPDRTGSQVAVPTATWTAPTTRENGAALSPKEIGGCEIYVAKKISTGVYKDTKVFTHVGSGTSLKLDGLTAGNYRASIAAYDTDGLYSDKTVLDWFSNLRIS